VFLHLRTKEFGVKTIVSKAGAILAAAVALTWAGTAQAASPWSLFGNAGEMKVGKDWVIALSSDVTSENTDDAFGGVAFVPKKDLTFSGIKRLSADYMLAEGTFGGGSPRFQISIGDGEGNHVGNVFVYLGTPPGFTDDTEGWQSSGNLIDATDLRFDTSQVGGTFYDDYEGAVELVGDSEVLGIQLVVDGGWAVEGGVQTVLVDDVRVNNSKLSGKNFDKK
jgi:hypothetical protein